MEDKKHEEELKRLHDRIKSGETRVHEPGLKAYSQRLVKERLENGVVVVKGKDRPFDLHRQANSKRYLSPHEPELSNTVLRQWEVFKAEIPPGGHNACHRHQGGLIIFILEGRGYSVFDTDEDRKAGKFTRYDWKAGDVVLLPVVPGGVWHQHFNTDPENYVYYLPFAWAPFKENMGIIAEEPEACESFQYYQKTLGENK